MAAFGTGPGIPAEQSMEYLEWTGGQQDDTSGMPVAPALVIPSSTLSGSGGRRKGTACTRCRLQKIRCDDEQPACSSCARAGHECVRSRAGRPNIDSYITALEEKVKWLEARLAGCVCHQNDRQQGDEHLTVTVNDGSGSKAVTPGPPPPPYYQVQAHTETHSSHHGSTVSPASAQQLSSPSESQIGPDEPLAHNVGLLCLSNARESKYLGPSSGVTLGKLVFSSMPGSQGLPVTLASSNRAKNNSNSRQLSTSRGTMQSTPPMTADLTYFAACYFELYQPLYPFLDEDIILARLHTVEEMNVPLDAKLAGSSPLSAADLVQLILVLALGAKNLEARLSTSFSADSYYAMALAHMDEVDVLGGIPGVQILLLLTLCSFIFENGLNAWYLSSTIIASCLDLGLQRKHSDLSPHNPSSPVGASTSTSILVRGLFWSAYSIDRTLTVILGRPLTLRDEAIDAPFPGHDELLLWSGHADVDSVASSSSPTTRSASQRPAPGSQANKRRQIGSDPHRVAMYSFWFDQITAEIKLMLHRVAQSPRRFPWPSDLGTWQTEVQSSCRTLLESLRGELRWKSSCLTDRSVQELELKYHQCIMLLHRPSPAIQHPGESSIAECYQSAMQTIQIYAQLHRFSNMPRTWLAAHALFVSGITMLYCVWTSHQIKDSTTLKTFSSHAESCIKLLAWLGETWSVAEDARAKLERLTAMTVASWRNNHSSSHDVAPGNTEGLSTTAATRLSSDGNQVEDQSRPGAAVAGSSNLFDHFEFGAMTEEWAGSQDVSNLFSGELGNMSSWFDLDWLVDSNFCTDKEGRA